MSLLDDFGEACRSTMETEALKLDLKRLELEHTLSQTTMSPELAAIFLRCAEAGEKWAAAIVAYSDMMRRHARRAGVGEGGES